jgi:site-specific DNA-methyltransferase (adenine-specific)
MQHDLRQGDCLDVMAELAPASVDLILCDLPYGTTACKWDSVIPFEPLWAQYRRLIKPNGAIVLTSAQPFTTALIGSNIEWFKYCWIWEKSKPTDFFNAKLKPLKAHEEVCVFSGGATANGSDRNMPYYPQGLVACGKTVRGDRKGGDSDEHGLHRKSHKAAYVREATGYPRSVLKFASEANPVHGTQKPVALMEYLIRTYTNEGDTVLDNCMGSGTTGVACANTGRKFIGIERDPGYFDIARKRIEAAHENSPLFDAACVA